MKAVYSPRYEVNIGPHVFPTSKYRLIREKLLAEGALAEEDIIESTLPPRDELALVHTPQMIDDLFNLRWTPHTMHSELPISREIVDAYVYACGGSIIAAREALTSPARMCFHIGGGFHHAFATRAEGFCYLNDIAVAIRVMQQEHHIVRAMVIDCDLHQGNGTAHIFAGDPHVFTMSIHQENNYPLKQVSDVDIGLADNTGDEEYLARLDGFLKEYLPKHRPELIMYVAGADPYEDDQLGGLRITMDGLKRRDELVLGAAATHRIPAAVVLAGGYARKVSDTVAIQAQTCKVALQLQM
jgi:acetoin utilization deacetylase AcuC-like enzyme